MLRMAKVSPPCRCIDGAGPGFLAGSVDFSPPAIVESAR